MYMSTLSEAFLLVIVSITFIQGRQIGKSKTKLVVYDPKSEKQSLPVDIEGPWDDSKNGVSIFEVPIYWVPCKCQQFQCICCIGIRLQNRNFDKRVCIRLALILPAMRLEVVIYVGNRKALGMSVPLINVPPICMSTFLPVPLFICLQIYKIVLPIGRDFEACLSLQLKFMVQSLFELKLGCIRMGTDGVGIFRQSLLEEIVSTEDGRINVERGNNDGISVECIVMDNKNFTTKL